MRALGVMSAARLLSLNAPGVQAEPDSGRGIASARQVNDTLAEFVAANPSRYGGLATLPMQDPAAAAAELNRCATQLGFPGVMLNGYQNVGDAATGWYYDHERYWPFWERAEALGVPVYLHPRDPLPGNQGIYEGHPELFGAVWTQTLDATIAEMGADRVLFSTDYPYESMREAAGWFDNAAINDNDRVKIGRSNSEKLFRLRQLVAA